MHKMQLEVAEVVLVQWNLLDDQYQQTPEVLYTFMPNRFYAYLLNVEPSNLVFLKTYNTEFDDIIKTFTDQNGIPLEIKDKVNLILLINKQKLQVILYNQGYKNMSSIWVFVIRDKSISEKCEKVFGNH